MAAWDQEVKWIGDPVEHLLPLSTELWAEFLRPVREGANVRIAAIRPKDEGTWLCWETGTGPGHVTADDLEIGEPGASVELRFGWSPPGAIDRMGEFDGW